MSTPGPVPGPPTTATAVSPDSGTHWTEEGAWPVAPGIHRIPLPLPMDGLRAVNVYAVETGDGLTLVDGGWAVQESRDVLTRSLRTIGATPADIGSFLVTHVHRDHYTQAVALRAEHGSHVRLGLGDKPSLDQIRTGFTDHDPHSWLLRRAGAHDLAGAWDEFNRGSSVDTSIWGYPDSWMDGEERIEVGGRVLDAVPTPGHTQGHYVFADVAEGLLFAGDHVLPTITPSIGFEGVVSDQPLGDFLASLARVRALPDLRLLPAHGPVAPSSHVRVEELLAHHEERLDRCLAEVGDREVTPYDVARLLGWTRHERHFDSLDVFNQALATMETRAHLVLLVARGHLTVRDADGPDGPGGPGSVEVFSAGTARPGGTPAAPPG